MGLPHEFKDEALLDLALTHSSTQRGEDNERLEFLGDAVLDLVIVEALYRDEGRFAEGPMTEMRSAIVSRRGLAEAAIRLVNGLPISAEILEAAIHDALDHCENDVEVSVHLHPADLKLLKESGSELLADSPHQRRVHYIKDVEISRGGCLVETRCGLIDGSRETREKLLRATVSR